jgi:hypothetical protein
LPGYALLLAVFGKNKVISTLERFVFSFGLSIVSVDFIFFAYSKLNISITRLSSIIGIGVFVLACYAIYKIRHRKELDPSRSLSASGGLGMTSQNNLFNFSKNQLILILLLLFLTVFIKVAYLSGTILPSATDLGHHMYWANWMAENGQLPTYEGMPDFIIGEHIIFGLFHIIGNLDFFSAFPPLVLLLINILGILTVFLLVLRIFKEKTIAILSLLFLGVLWAISSPQAKFVSGGVVGNIMGNLFVPMAFYFYYRAFSAIGGSASGGELNSETSTNLRISKAFLSLAIFMTFGLFYTHHLTAFIFLFISVLLVIIFLITNLRDIEKILPKIYKTFLSSWVLGTFFLGLIFFFFVFTPTYIQTSAVETAVGAPSKNTRAGLSITSLKNSLGEARIALGFLGIMVMAFYYKRKNLGYGILVAWAIMLFIMSSQPGWLFINLPSDRIGNYLSYPLSILSAYAFFMVFKKFNNSFSSNFIKISFILIIGFVFVGGMSDSAGFFKQKIESEKLLETFNASAYLASATTPKDAILKDHVYLTGDSWIKLFFMRDYKYPLSRGYLKRYEDTTKPREMCTLYMISNPGSEDAQKCFEDSSVNFIMINPAYDSSQFKKLNNFDQIYANKDIAIFYRKY